MSFHTNSYGDAARSVNEPLDFAAALVFAVESHVRGSYAFQNPAGLFNRIGAMVGMQYSDGDSRQARLKEVIELCRRK
jgi:hypothetical protein